MPSIFNHRPTVQPQANANTIPAQIKNMMRTLNTVKNPTAALQQVAQSNPDFARVLNMCQGQNPRDVFYKMCQERGVDPNSILSQIQ